MIDFTTYDITPFLDGDNITYTFMSEGHNNVLKAIRYSPVPSQNAKPIYNLGFGDLDASADLGSITDIEDNVVTNNGDHYGVFGTVLSSIPLFFESCPSGMILVQGSDSALDFPTKCRPVCTKRCSSKHCKNFGRRIRTYCLFVSRRYEIITQEYFVYGIIHDQGVNNAEPFVKYKTYDALLIYKL